MTSLARDRVCRGSSLQTICCVERVPRITLPKETRNERARVERADYTTIRVFQKKQLAAIIVGAASLITEY